MGVRERNYRQTRHRLIEAARDLFDEYGYEGTTIETIADAADVSPRTFHRYFETKAGIASAPCWDLVEQVAADVRPHWSVGDIVDALGTAIEQALATGDIDWVIRIHRETPALVMEAPARRQRWADELARAIAVADGRTETSLFDRARASIAVQVVGIAIDEWMLRRPDDDFGQVLTEVSDLLCAPVART